jgi:DNA-binding MarR family transcriptional regulator
MDEIDQCSEMQMDQAGAGCEAMDVPPTPFNAAQSDLVGGLIQLSFLVQSVYTRVSERHDLTPVQAKLLCMVADAPRRMADLANCFGVEKAALTGLVDRAERRGLAKRTTVPGDRRALRVVPTEIGCQAVTAFKTEVAAELGRLIAGLSPEDCEHLQCAIAKIVTA